MLLLLDIQPTSTRKRTQLEPHVPQTLVATDRADLIVFGLVISQFSHLRRVAGDGRGAVVLSVVAPCEPGPGLIAVPFAGVHLDAHADDSNDYDEKDECDGDVPSDQPDYHAARQQILFL